MGHMYISIDADTNFVYIYAQKYIVRYSDVRFVSVDADFCCTVFTLY